MIFGNKSIIVELAIFGVCLIKKIDIYEHGALHLGRTLVNSEKMVKNQYKYREKFSVMIRKLRDYFGVHNQT